MSYGKIFLIRPNTTADYLVRSSRPTAFINIVREEDLSFEHLGLGYLSAYLGAHGFHVDICDTVLSQITNDEIVNRVASDDHPLVGITVPSQRAIFTVLKLAEEIKQCSPDTHLCLGGHFPTATHDLLLRDFPFIDSVVRGEGEKPLLALAFSVLSGRSLNGVPGLTHRCHGKIVSEPPVAPVTNLDDLPFPRRQGLPIKWRNIRYAAMVSSRGCQYKCSYCSISNFYGCSKWRSRSVANVVEEIAELYSRQGYTGFDFSDDNFVPPGPAGIERVNEFCKALWSRGLSKLTLVAMLAPASVSEATISQLFKVGLRSVLVGIESGSPAQLKRLRKPTTRSINSRVLEILRAFDLAISTGWIMFDPDSSLSDIKMNIDFLKPHVNYVTFEPLNRLDVYTGTDLYQELARRGRLKGTYLDPYYDFADRKVAWVYDVSTQLMQDWIGRMSQWTALQDDRLYGRARRQQMLSFVLDILKHLTDYAEMTTPLPPVEEAFAKLEGAVASGFKCLMTPMNNRKTERTRDRSVSH